MKEDILNVTITIAFIVSVAFVANSVAFPSVFVNVVILSVIWTGLTFVAFTSFDIVRLSSTIRYHDKIRVMLNNIDSNDILSYNRVSKEIHDFRLKSRGSWNSRIRERAITSIAHNYLMQFESEWC